MSVSKLSSGRWRAQVYDSSTGKNIPVADVIGGERSFATKREAKSAREDARKILAKRHRHGITVSVFRDRWLTDKLFATPKESTRLHYAERTRRFADEHADIPIDQITDAHVTAWLGRGYASTVPALRAMFNAAASRKAGSLIESNPFNGLDLERSKGNGEKHPPSEQTVRDIVTTARRLSGPYWSGWLQVAAYTGMRPAELDALRWDRVDFTRGLIHVDEQFNVKTRTFTLPKNGMKRFALLTPPAREALEALPRVSEFCFVNSQREHFTHKSRTRHWQKTRDAVGLTDTTLYLCTRHFAGWYMVNELLLETEDVAIALGHTDGGDQVRKTYGHRDRMRALDRVQAAYSSREIERVGRSLELVAS